MLIYEGKAKKILKSDREDQVIIHFKDDTTAFNGVKKAQIENKGKLNLQITTHIFKYLLENNIDNHFIKLIDEDCMLAKKVDIIPLEFICRNRVMGSMKKRLGYKKEVDLDFPVLEICYKEDALNDPLINDYHAYALGLCNKEQLDYMYSLTLKINELLIKYFLSSDLILADFKIEFGTDTDGNIILADEISPDSCRLIDKNTKKQLDKDLFRLDIGDISQSYKEILDRLKK
jgi:phosphoribosylaminoimidazole-succinocarboxamide synthase